jgi:predicted  nucleic acid-binding Zn-ribbon protein
MDKAVIDELFSDVEEVKFRHSDEEVQEAAAKGSERMSALRDQIAVAKENLAAIQAEAMALRNRQEDLYEDLDFTQQSARGGAADALTRQAEDLEQTADELYSAIDALSNILLFRFKEV